MKKAPYMSVIVVLVSLLVIGTSAKADGLKPSVHSAVLDFHPGWVAGTNPNDVWSYGWSLGVTGEVTLFPNPYLDVGVDNGMAQVWDRP
jgi:hypothetical protein